MFDIGDPPFHNFTFSIKGYDGSEDEGLTLSTIGMATGKFRDKVVVVTGAASGIGLAVCRRLAADGAKIGLLDMDEPALDAVQRELADQGVDGLSVRCDVSRRVDG